MYAVVGCFIAMDFATGLIKALKNKNYTSTVMREGLFHKCGSVLCVGFGSLVDYAQQVLDLGVTVPFAVAISTYVVLMECGSIIENLGEINPQIVPDTLKAYFGKLNS